MYLETVILREIRLPLREPFVISSGIQHLRRILLLEVHDGDGRTGWSECVAQEQPNYSPETLDTAWLALREWLVPAIRGADAQDPTDILPILDAGVRGHQMAKAAIEMACWHLKSLREDRSLAATLGGTRRRIPVGISVGIQPDPAALVDKITRYREDGYRKIKVKIKPGADRAYLHAVRDAFGNELPLAADANSAYTLDDIELLKSFDGFKLLMLEQPLQHDDLVRHARLQEEIGTPICLDESITSLERAEDMLYLSSARIVNIKPGRVGGMRASIAIHDLCQQHGVPVWCGGMLESGIGRAHNVALASLPNFSIPGDISPSSRYWEEDIVKPEWTMSRDGCVDVPVEPGLGVEVDLDRIENLTVRKESI